MIFNRTKRFVAMTFAKESPFLEPFMRTINKMTQYGVMKKLLDKYEPIVHTTCEERKVFASKEKLLFIFILSNILISESSWLSTIDFSIHITRIWNSSKCSLGTSRKNETIDQYEIITFFEDNKSSCPCCLSSFYSQPEHWIPIRYVNVIVV